MLIEKDFEQAFKFVKMTNVLGQDISPKIYDNNHPLPTLTPFQPIPKTEMSLCDLWSKWMQTTLKLSRRKVG